MNKSSRIIAVALVIVTIFFTVSYFYLTHKIDTLKNEKYLQHSVAMKNELQSLIKEKSESILLVTLGLCVNQNIKNAIKKKEHKNINLDNLTVMLKHYASLEHVWFQIITPAGKSFYRSWSDKREDDLTGVRPEILQMIQSPKVISTISTGKYDMTFKAMVPIFEDGKFIGIVETIAKFYSISKKMNKRGSELLIVVDKKYKKQLNNSYTRTFIDDYYIVDSLQNKKLLHIVQNNSIEKYLHIATYIIDKKNSLLITTSQLPNINGNPMGYFIISKDLKKIDFSNIEETKKSILEINLLIFIMIILLFYYFYIVSYKRFVQRQNEILESTIAKKTKELKLQTDTLTFIAHHDNLTGLANKVLLLDRTEEAIKNIQTSKEQLSLFFLDLDRFKEVNDTYGQEIGDELLLQLTQRLQESIKDNDMLARLGGDEFTILHSSATKTSTINIIDTIFLQMKRPFYVRNIEIFTTFSIGVTLYPRDADEATSLLRNAETAMYKAKDKGKNTYQFYDKQMTELALQRIQLDADIRKALKYEEFVPYFQPKIDARDGKIIGLEALIRWIHPEKGIIAPYKFIPFCEETGLVVEIDKYMLIKAMEQVLQWRKEGLKFGKVSVNVSTKKIESSNYIEELSFIIKTLQFDTSILDLEILEGQIMRDPQKSIYILNELRNLGISISIDDFGTGYSSLSYLKKLPVNKIKIDRSFIMDIPSDKDDMAIVKTIIALAKNLGLEIIAEGVETKQQLDFLLQEGCYNIQGYYFSKPLPVAECREFIIANSKGV